MALRLQDVKEERVNSLRVRVYRSRDETGTAAGEAAAARMKELLAQKNVPGERKRHAVVRTVRGPFAPDCPSASLRTHPDCLLFLDELSFTVTER